MIATKFVICLLASVVVTMGFKLDEGDEGFSRRQADEALEGSPHREADETLELSAVDAGDAAFTPADEQTDDGSLSREADSEGIAVESENAESHNSTLARQASYPSGCGWGRPAPSHLALRIVNEAFDIYSSATSRRDAIWRSLEQAKKSPHVVTVGSCLPADLRYSYDCVYYKGWYSNIYY